MFDVLLAEVTSPSDGQPFKHLPIQKLAGELFDLGSAAGVKARNREALYTISAMLEKAANKRRKLTKPKQHNGDMEAAGTMSNVQHGDSGVLKPQSAITQSQATDAHDRPADHEPHSNRSSKQRRKQHGSKKVLQQQHNGTAVAHSDAVSKPGDSLLQEQGKAAAPSPNQPQQQQQPPTSQLSGPAVLKPLHAPMHSTLKTAGSGATLSPAPVPVDNPMTPEHPAAQLATHSTTGKKQRKGYGMKGSQGQLPMGSQTVPAKGNSTKGSVTGAAMSTGRKKAVRINERENLYFDVGGAVPEPGSRTPLAARPKGSALKTPTKAHASASAPSPAASGAQRVSPPNTRPRPKASAFF